MVSANVFDDHDELGDIPDGIGNRQFNWCMPRWTFADTEHLGFGTPSRFDPCRIRHKRRLTPNCRFATRVACIERRERDMPGVTGQQLFRIHG